MTALTSAAWVVHDVGLAAAIGGPLFEYTAMAPALANASDTSQRDRISVDAAQRFSLIKLVSHASFAVPWIIGRTMRSGREVSATARKLTVAKDVLVGISFVSGLIGLLGVKRVRDRAEQGENTQGRTKNQLPTKSGGMGAIGMLNMVANAGILGITALLAMEGTKSVCFARSSRRLP